MSKPKYSFQPLSGVPFASSALHRLVSPQLSLASHTTQPSLHPIVRKMSLLFCIAIIIKYCSEVNGRSYMTIAGVTITDEMVNVLQVKHSNNTAVRALADRSAKQSNSHRGISDLLDSLLQGYDNSIRPDFGGPPAEVEVDIMVRSMGPISEVDMTYSMDCYFRQSWVDRRLAFEGSEEPLALSVSMLRKIWKPDTYFYNGKQSYLHTITAPNKFVRLFQNGRVLYSSRLTIKAGCPMNLEDFPMDTQRCPLKFGSFGYTTKDVLYRWNGKRQVAIAEDMKLSQFDLVANPSANHTDLISLPNSEFAIREYSMLLVSFHLRRHMGNFLIQVYGPCILLVVLSWVSFWLNREATADRISLGITTVLTMTFLGLEARTDLPKVPYLTALDLFVFLSFAFIFATIIQFAIVHYFTKYGSGECYFSMEINSDVSSEEEPEVETWPEDMKAKPLSVLEVIPLSSYTIPIRHLQPRPAPKQHPVLSCCGSQDPVVPPREKRPTPATHVTHSPKAKPTTSTSRKLSITSVTGSISQAIRSLHSPRASLLGTIQKKRKKRTPRFNSVSKVDKVSRIFFPLLFAAINVFYWYCYLSRSQRMQRKSVMVT